MYIDNLSIIYNSYLPPFAGRLWILSFQLVAVVHDGFAHNLLGFLERAVQASAAGVEMSAPVEELGSHRVAWKVVNRAQA